MSPEEKILRQIAKLDKGGHPRYPDKGGADHGGHPRYPDKGGHPRYPDKGGGDAY